MSVEAVAVKCAAFNLKQCSAESDGHVFPLMEGCGVIMYTFSFNVRLPMSHATRSSNDLDVSQYGNAFALAVRHPW